MSMKVRVVLVEPEGEVNVGSVIRLACNYGVDEVVLVNPKVVVGDVVLRYAAKGASVLASRVIVERSLKDALREVEVSACTTAVVGGEKDVLRHPMSLREFAESLSGGVRSVALVFGRESVGLRRSELAECDVLVTIPAHPGYPVLNLSHAVAVALYELYVTAMRRGLHKAVPGPPISDYELAERLCKEVCELLGIPDDRGALMCLALRRLLFKGLPTRAEVRNVIYLLSRVKSKLGRAAGAEA